jgi:uncharacterized protein YjbI with pentapeptide repeats
MKEKSLWAKTCEKLVAAGVDADRLPDEWEPGIDLRGVNLGSADLRYALLDGVDLRGTFLNDANLKLARLNDTRLENANLSNANLWRAVLQGAHLGNAILNDANLEGAYLSSANMTNASLRCADLRGAIIRQADLSEADLFKADLSWTSLKGSNLTCVEANLTVFVGARMQGIDLQSSTLCRADLRKAEMSRANLWHADLRDADFRDTTLTGAILDGVIYDHNTIGIQPAPEGDLIGWGKKSGNIVKLLIPADARRSCASSRKYRAEYVKVLEIADGARSEISHYSHYATDEDSAVTIYKVGEITYADQWDDDRWEECSHGIHFFLSHQEAEAWKA